MYKILVIDDNETIRKILRHHLRKIGCDVAVAAGATAVSKAIKYIPDLVLLDLDMAGMSGYDILREFRTYEQFKDCPVVIVSPHKDRESIINAFKKGANDYVVKPFDIGVLIGKIVGWQHSRMECQWSELPDDIGKALRLLKVAMNESVENIIKSNPLPLSTIRTACEILYLTLDNKNIAPILRAVDGYNSTLFLRSLLICVNIMLYTKYNGYKKEDIIDMSIAGFLQNIGSAKIPDKIIFKPGNLDPNEYDEVKLHVQYGIDIMDKTPDMPDVIKLICKFHHERIDGSGYPYGIKGDQICDEAHLAAIVETYCAITTKSVYREAKTTEEAVNIMMSMDALLNHIILKDFIRAVKNKFILPVSNVNPIPHTNTHN
ncbi:MAG: response regulator [Nitrospirae bacterium]|nr:response regulator [Nitrospirota bacterium]